MICDVGIRKVRRQIQHHFRWYARPYFVPLPLQSPDFLLEPMTTNDQ